MLIYKNSYTKQHVQSQNLLPTINVLDLDNSFENSRKQPIKYIWVVFEITAQVI